MTDLGYILGVLVGDGSLIKHRSHYIIRLATISKIFADKFEDSLHKLTGKKVQRHMRPAFQLKAKNGKIYDGKEQFIVKIYSKYWFSKFSALLSLLRRGKFPIQSSEAISFLEGFFDSEGSYERSYKRTKKRLLHRIQIYNTNKLLINLVLNLLKSFGFHPCGLYINRSANSPNPTFFLTMNRQDEINRFREMISNGIKWRKSTK